jgi:hypothetical protein
LLQDREVLGVGHDEASRGWTLIALRRPGRSLCYFFL